MKYYTYGYEDYKGNKGEITVKAQTERDADNRLSDYDVCRGGVHYAWLLFVEEDGIEKYYKKENNAMGLAIALVGAALGHSQIAKYGIKRNYLDCLEDKEVVELINE